MLLGCALLDGFAIGARVALLRQHNANVLVLGLCLVKNVVQNSSVELVEIPQCSCLNARDKRSEERRR